MGAAASSRGEGDGAGEAGAGDEQREAADGRTIKFADEELDDDADRKQARDHLCGMWGRTDGILVSGRQKRLSWMRTGRRRRRRRSWRRIRLRRRRPERRRKRRR